MRSERAARRCSLASTHDHGRAKPRGEEKPRLSKDITSILTGWDHDPEEVQVRIVAGDDGHDKIQMRLDLGLIQMEVSGRPDGTRPEGAESLLDVFEAHARESESVGEDFALDSQDCAALMREGMQYYQRYLAAFHLQRYDLVARDTARNLRLFAFVVRFARQQRDRLQFDQFRPYVTMMNTRARALQALARQDHRQALALIDEGIKGIRRFLLDYERSESESDCAELGFLLRWRREVESERPAGPVERLERQLELAVAREEFEEAARIRDQLRRLLGTEAAPEVLPDRRGVPHFCRADLKQAQSAARLTNVRLRSDKPLPMFDKGQFFWRTSENPLGAAPRPLGWSLKVSGTHFNCGFSKAAPTA